MALVSLALTLAPVAAPFLAGTHPLLAMCIRSFYSRVCHQDAARSFAMDGSPVAVCVRCLGIYCGVGLGMLVRTDRDFALGWLVMASLVNVVDVAGEQLHLHGSLPVLRLIFGVLLGMGCGAVLSGREKQERELA